MTVFVTGGAGFIGSTLCRFLLRKHKNMRVICIDKLTYAGSRKNIQELCDSSSFKFVQADITDLKQLNSIFSEEKPDMVINLAAETHVDRSIKDPHPFLHTNITGTCVLLECCVRHSVQRFHQVSTDEVYGDMELDCCEAFTESSPLRPSSPYASSKASADLLALSFQRTYGLHVTISRCSNNFGPFQHSEKLLPVIIQCTINGSNVPIYGDGKNMRDWIYAEDHCRAIDLIATHGAPGSIYNVGGGNLMSNLELVKKVLNMCGKPEDRYSFVADRKGHDRKYMVDCSKIQRELGWKPAFDFEQALSDTVTWYMEK